MDVTFLRGPCRGGALLRPYRVHPKGFPYEGKAIGCALSSSPLPQGEPKNRPAGFPGRAVWVWAYSKTTFSALQTAAQRGQRPCSSGVSECIQQRGHFVPFASLTATVRPG